MAHQSSEILKKQATPRSIGRLMDVEFSAVFLIAPIRRERAANCDSRAMDQKLPTVETALMAHLPWQQSRNCLSQ